MLEFRRTNLNKRHDLQETSNFWELLSFKMIYPAPAAAAASQRGDITVSDPDFRGKDDEDEADPNPNHTQASLSEAC